MIMAPFEFNSTTHFVASSESTTIDVYELTPSTTSPSSAVRTTDWKIVATVAGSQPLVTNSRRINTTP
ncbi:unnamed protein product [Linum trigynum]|uniref:Uncharacterized protein n=1 Tax=Linum trigynum TaxID=586398 RepID=A0AAV2F0B7_9ROSI